jgi:ribA/ribD-fused uncharacterized protein
LPPQLWHAAKLPPRITDKYLFFFGYEGDDPHVCLQQWFPSPFAGPRDSFLGDVDVGDGVGGARSMIDFPTSEHFMMYHKALLMGDVSTAQKIVDAEHPSEAKSLGRLVRDFNQDRWDRYADRIVEEGNRYKFGDERNKDLKEVLLTTGRRIIVEASPDDRIWGIGFDAIVAEGQEDHWGNNGLGKALMKVRDRLRNEERT